MAASDLNSETQSLQQQLIDPVKSKLHGRIREFHVLLMNGGLVLTGFTRSYYAKQLAQHLVMKMTELPILVNDIRVQCR